MIPESKTALITGAARGIGYAIANQLASEGVTVVIADVDESGAGEAVQALRDQDLQAFPVVMDVSDPEAVESAVSEAVQNAGDINILVNNAGICLDTPALEVPLEVWQRNLAIMLTGPLLCTRQVAPGLKAAGWGRIINISSLMAVLAFGRDVAYCTSKSGLLGLNRSLAAELAPEICVNAVCPGNIHSQMMQAVAEKVAVRDGISAEEFYEMRSRQIPLHRLGDVEEVARTVSFLCSDKADYITGQTIHVNGGLYMT